MTPDRFRFNPEMMSLDPAHFKKVVYLDQFVISEIVNAIDPHAKAHARVDPFWRQVFEALERVSKTPVGCLSVVADSSGRVATLGQI